jgi:hypothetical protein
MPSDLVKEHRTHNFFPMGLGKVKVMEGIQICVGQRDESWDMCLK